VKRLVVLAAVLALVAPASAASPRILPFQDWWPVWAPDGSRIAFTRVFANGMALEVVRGGRVTELARNLGQLSPSWAPGSRSLAFSAGGRIVVADSGGGARRTVVGPPGRSFAPSWSPDGRSIAFLTTRGARNTDLWLVAPDGSGARLLARDAIGRPAWSPDSAQVAFQRDDGIYAVGVETGQARRVASVASPRAPAWSPNGKQIAYVAADRLWIVPADGSKTPTESPSTRREGFRGLGDPSWSFDSNRIVLSHGRGVWVTLGAGGYSVAPDVRRFGAGAAFAPRSYFVAFSGSRRACPGHLAILRRGVSGPVTTLTGACTVVGTSRADTIEGSPDFGDVILGLGGNDQIHANDGHTDRVDCGPGRDTVWADRTDRLRRCEIVR
jgi:dipeptidyl aminopeptidase/acylaminoacyl peptidase